MLLITGGQRDGGNSAEVYVPSTGAHCELPAIPGDGRFQHTLENMTLCGGYASSNTLKSCLTLEDGQWKATTTLLEDR